MIVTALCILPFLAGVATFLIKNSLARRCLLLATAVVHLALTLVTWGGAESDPGALVGVDPLGRLFLTITSFLFLLACVYAMDYLSNEDPGQRHDIMGDPDFSNAPEAVFIGCMLFFLSSMTVVCMSRHLTLLWTAIEATTLASAPLIYFHRHKRSLEATWKYLLVCSVGIGLALLGNFMLVLAAARQMPSDARPLLLDNLLAAHGLDPGWLRLGCIFLVVGYGTKMGLAPLHTWLPDTHSESPSLVSALLSGALLNCSFLGILRVLHVCTVAGQGDFVQRLMLGFGLASMAVAATFLLNSRDYKRMLAYSSVEHMGILALGVGLGGPGLFAALLHAVNHSLCKASMFLSAGNILQVYGTRAVVGVRGVRRVLPITGCLWLGGFLALTGTPPFGPFISEFLILKATLGPGHSPWLAASFLLLLALAFIGMCRPVLHMVLGPCPLRDAEPRREPFARWMPPAILLGLSLMLGFYLPPTLKTGLEQAASTLERRVVADPPRAQLTFRQQEGQ